MEKKNEGLKSFLITLAVIIFSIVLFIVKIFINSIPKEDFPLVTPIIVGVILVASVGYLIYTIFFSKDSFYRKKYLEKKTNKEKKEKTLKEVYKNEKKTGDRKVNRIYFMVISTIFLITLIGLFYWFEYRPTEIKKSCAYTTFTIPEVKEVSKEEAESSKLENEFCKEQIELNLNLNDGEEINIRAIDRLFLEDECDRKYPIKEETEYQPQKESRREATEREYNNCLRRNGLLQ